MIRNTMKKEIPKTTDGLTPWEAFTSWYDMPM